MDNDIIAISDKLKKISTPIQRYEFSKLEFELNSMSEKVKAVSDKLKTILTPIHTYEKENIDKTDYAENELINTAKIAMEEAIGLMRKEEKIYAGKIASMRLDMQKILINMVNNLNNASQKVIDRFRSDLVSIAQVEMSKNKNMISEFKYEISKLKDSVISEIDIKISKSLKDIDVKVLEKIKEIESIEPKPVQPSKEPIIEKETGNPEHFVDNIHVEKGGGKTKEIITNYKDLENLDKRKGSPDELLK